MTGWSQAHTITRHKKDKPTKTVTTNNVGKAKAVETPAAAAQTPSMPAPQTGTVELHGYTYIWDDFNKTSDTNDNGVFRLITDNQYTHYIEINHMTNGANYLHNFIPREDWKAKWSNLQLPLDVPLPMGVFIRSDDEFIFWEQERDGDFKCVIRLIWSPASNTLQCLRTDIQGYKGKKYYNHFYFRTVDASAWGKIKPILLQELPYFAPRAD